MRHLLLTALFLFTQHLFAQACPKDIDIPPSSELRRTLHGQLIYHDDLRQWFELKLDQPVCGQPSIQLIRISGSYAPLETARGCRVTTTGIIGLAPTGYYSLDSYQDVESIRPELGCHLLPRFPDYSHVAPDASIKRYRVEMEINYRPGDHPILFRISSSQHALTPWQAYASYDLTGGFVLYGHCGKGFVVDNVSGPVEANPFHFGEPRTPSDRAAFDPESAAASGRSDLKLVYTCVRMK